MNTFICVNIGCRESNIESNYLSTHCFNKGLKLAEHINSADLIILNTCGFSKEKEDLTIKQYRYILSIKKDCARVVLAGCLPFINKNVLNEIKYNDIVISPRDPENIEKVFSDIITEEKIIKLQEKSITSYLNDNPEYLNKIRRITEKLIYKYKIQVPRWLWQTLYLPSNTTPFVKVSMGCLGICSYCSIRKAKGSIKSYNFESILNSINSLSNSGQELITLSADDLGAYGQDIGMNISFLLKSILSISDKFKLILRNFEPNWLIKYWTDLEDVFKSGRIVYIISPVQSGNDKILTQMKRGYSRDEILNVIRKMRKISPRTIFRTHIISGFPGESFYDFASTCFYLLKLPSDHFSSFGYSDRPGTVSSTMVQKKSNFTVKFRCSIMKSINVISFLKYSRWFPLRPF